MTHPVSQAVLQAKHDPIDARHKYELLMGSARRIWRGREVVKTTDYDGSTVWRKTDNEDQMRAEDWVDNFCEFYESKEGLNIPVNRNQVEKIAKVLSDDHGYIMNVEMEGLDILGSPMDKLSYTPSYELLQTLANEKANLFEGKFTSQFAPSSIQRNIEAQNKGLETKALIKQDVIVKKDKEVVVEVDQKPIEVGIKKSAEADVKSTIPDLVADNARASREALIEQMLGNDFDSKNLEQHGPNL